MFSYSKFRLFINQDFRILWDLKIGKVSITCNRVWLICSLLLGLCLLQGCSRNWDQGTILVQCHFSTASGLTTVDIPSSRIPKQEKAVSSWITTVTSVRRPLEMLSETISLWIQNQDLKGPRHYSSLPPFPFLPLPKLSPFLGCNSLWSLPGVPGALPQVGTRGNIPFLHGDWIHEKAIGDRHSISYGTGWTNDWVLNGWLFSNLCILPNEAVNSNLQKANIKPCPFISINCKPTPQVPWAGVWWDFPQTQISKRDHHQYFSGPQGHIIPLRPTQNCTLMHFCVQMCFLEESPQIKVKKRERWKAPVSESQDYSGPYLRRLCSWDQYLPR